MAIREKYSQDRISMGEIRVWAMHISSILDMAILTDVVRAC